MRLLGCCFIIASLSEAERKLQGPEDQIRPNKREEEEEEKKIRKSNRHAQQIIKIRKKVLGYSIMMDRYAEEH